jgi:putative transposase
MPRSVRIEYPGAVYHVMCRGDRREAIFQDDADREMFLATLAEMCGRTGAVIHSYVLMSNHYHLLMETPAGNLVTGMKWFQGTYTQRFNARHRLNGHLFQGRCKAIPMETERPEFFRVVSDYIHLNPARAGLLDRREPELVGYRWSSFAEFVQKARLPSWLQRGKVFASLDLPDERAGSRRRYGGWMAERVADILEATTSAEQQEQWRQLRRGWYLGSDGFRDQLMDYAARAVTGHQRASYEGAALQRHDEDEAERLVSGALTQLGMLSEELATRKRNDPAKQAVAWLVKGRTVVSDTWIVKRLEMGDRTNVSRAVAAFRTPDKERKPLKSVLHVCTD